MSFYYIGTAKKITSPANKYIDIAKKCTSPAI